MKSQVSQSIAQKSSSNLAQALVVLPRDRAQAMEVLYAFCREVDDVADEGTQEVGERRALLAAWREDVRAACEGREARFPVNRELMPVVARHRLPFALFDEVIRGVEMDLEVLRYATYEALETYCYRVASAVGLLSIEIFGYENQRCREYAVALGKALQFTNILRDVGNDARRGRIYLPQEALERHGVREEEILHGEFSDRFGRVAAEFHARAVGFYQEAGRLLPAEDRKAMVAAELMGAVYWRLLQRLEREGFRVLGEKTVRLNGATKVFLVLRTWIRIAVGWPGANYARG